MATIRVQTEDFDPGAEIEGLARGHEEVGAVASFVGLVRDVNDERRVAALHLEHYPGMTEREIARIVEEAQRRWRLVDVTVVHRVGDLVPGDRIVLVVVASAHRGDAFAACQFIMDFLKTEAPFWKKEHTGADERWVESRESDDRAARRWNS